MAMRFLPTSRAKKPVDDDSTSGIALLNTGDDGKRASSLFQIRERKPAGGWRFGVFANLGTVKLVLVINLTFAFVIYKRSGFSNGLGTLYTGTCSKTHSLNAAAHVLVSVLSAFILAGSNYCIHILSAPSRRDVDRAHAKSVWLDIGVSSFRNLRSLGWKPATLCLGLGLSSVLFPLFYNAVMFSSVSINQYSIITVTESFTRNTSVDFSSFSTKDLQTGNDQLVLALQKEAVSGNLTRLENEDCIDAYAEPFQSLWSNLLLVVDPPENKPNVSYIGSELSGLPQIPPKNSSLSDLSGWICGGENNLYPCQETKLAGVKADAAQWTPMGNRVNYCLSETAPQTCKLQLSLPLLIAAMFCNIIQLAIMAYVSTTTKKNPLLNIGDAIFSFLGRPDPTTKEMSLCSKKDFQRLKHPWSSQWVPTVYDGKPQHWFNALTPSRWAVVMTISIIPLFIAIFFLSYNVINTIGSSSALFKLGLNHISPRTLIQAWTMAQGSWPSLTLNLLIANAPQLIIAILYLLYNHLFTSMLQAREWSDFSQSKRGLRVSSKPKGTQRTSYYLQLSYKYSHALIALSAALHWLAHQAFFVVNIEVYTSKASAATTENTIHIEYIHADGDTGRVASAYSPLAMLLLVIISAIWMLFAALTALRRLNPNSPPLAGSCSAAISAACHVPVKDGNEDIALRPVQWGLVREVAGGCYGFGDKVERAGVLGWAV